MDREQVEELILTLERIALAAEHTHKCEEEISQTLKKILKLHKAWFGDSRGTVIPKKKP